MATNKEPLRIAFGLDNSVFILTSVYAQKIICGMDTIKASIWPKFHLKFIIVLIVLINLIHLNALNNKLIKSVDTAEIEGKELVWFGENRLNQTGLSV